MNMNEIVNGVKLSKVCSIKPDADSNESKQINLEIQFDGVPLQAVFQKAIAQTVIQWQNGIGRKKFNTWKNGQTVTIQFRAPASAQVNPEEAMANKLAVMSPEEQKEYIAQLLAKAEKLTEEVEDIVA